MTFKHLAAACLIAASSFGATAATYNTAKFVNTGPGLVSLQGFGRGASNDFAPTDSFSEAAVDARVGFFDTWNIDTSAIAPGSYSFSSMLIEAFGDVRFSSVTFNSFDAAGVRSTILFDLNADGTLATGSGVFSVVATCPVQSCVFIDLAGTQEAGGPAANYGGTVVAALVPEPSSYLLMALGLVALTVAARRRTPG